MKRRLLEEEGKANTEHSVGLLFPGGHSSASPRRTPRCLPLKNGRPGASLVERYPPPCYSPNACWLHLLWGWSASLDWRESKTKQQTKATGVWRDLSVQLCWNQGLEGKGHATAAGSPWVAERYQWGLAPCIAAFEFSLFLASFSQRSCTEQIQGHSLNITSARDNAMLTFSCSCKSTEL